LCVHPFRPIWTKRFLQRSPNYRPSGGEAARSCLGLAALAEIAKVCRSAYDTAMNIFAIFEDRIRGVLEELRADGTLPSDSRLDGFLVEPPREAAHGDLATNAAMVLAKAARKNPKELAASIVKRLRESQDVETAEIAGPGFINLTLKPDFWPAVLRDVLTHGKDYGRCNIGAGELVNVEYVSANPTGPIHVGHTRGAVFGDSLANLLEFAGYKPAREYYINDGGGQVDVLARSAFLRYREALGEETGGIPEGLYPGDYLKPVGEALAKEHGKRLLRMEEASWLPKVRARAVSMMMDLIRGDLAALGIEHEVLFSERSLSEGETDQVRDTIEELRAKGLVYAGRLDPPKGKAPEDWEDREQTLFQSTLFGDDVDRALLKSDGSYTYFAPDIAYHRNKYQRGFKHMIIVLGADHGGYVKRLTAAVKALSGGEADVDVKLCQIVRLFKGGQPYKMSKRAGSFITARDLVDEVGAGPVRFMMVYRKNDAPLDFDLEKVVEQSNDNPVFYVQYAHARACSVLAKAREAFPGMDLMASALAGAKLNLLSDEAELALIKKIAQFPRMLEGAAQAHEPHRIAFFAHDLAAVFHSLWTRGKELPQLRFMVQGSWDITEARLALITASAQILRSSLSLLGVEAISEMR
jgi:arginyl-tRNA synthetase